MIRTKPIEWESYIDFGRQTKWRLSADGWVAIVEPLVSYPPPPSYGWSLYGPGANGVASASGVSPKLNSAKRAARKAFNEARKG